MRWLKHLSMAHADQQVALLLEEHGPEPYGAWWLIIEHIAAPMERDRMTPEATHSEQSWAGIIHVSRKNVRRIFQILEKSRLITTSTIDGRIRIEVRNILKYKDEYSKKSGQTTASSPETPPTQTHTDTETEQRSTHTGVRVSGVRPPKVADLGDPVSQRFTEFWNLYPRKQGKENACRLWVSFVTASNESAVFECLRRYLASDEVSRGIISNPDNWLNSQHRDGWGGEWPAKNGSSRNGAPLNFPAKKDFVSDVTEVMQRRVARGEAPL